MKYLLTLVITLFFFALSYKSAPAEFLTLDLIVISCLLVGAVVMQCLLARVLTRLGMSENRLLTAFTIFNIVAFNLSINESFLWLPRLTGQVPALLVGAFIVYTLFDMMDGHRIFRLALPGLFALGSVQVFVIAVMSLTPTVADPNTAPGRTTSPDVHLVEFGIRPNVYFVSFDSLIPEPLLKKHMDLDTTPYHEVLEANFRRFRNFFADRIPSKPSLNSVLALDVDYYDAAEEAGTQYNFFTGMRPSPLLELFKHNGYETSTFYRGYYFGKTKGPFVDYYRFTQQGNSRFAAFLNDPDGICEFIKSNGIKAIRFMGYCFLTRLGFLQRDGAESERQDQMGALVAHMRAQLDKDAPQVMVAYIYSPGHTALEYNPADPQNLAEYRDYYMRQSQETAGYLETLINFVRQEDPTALLYVFGDHGPYVSRRLTVQEDALFVVQDRHGVYGGMFPQERCADTFDALDPDGFNTVALTARLIVTCLAEGQDAFETEKDYRLPDLAPGFVRNYEEYLYE